MNEQKNAELKEKYRDIWDWSHLPATAEEVSEMTDLSVDETRAVLDEYTQAGAMFSAEIKGQIHYAQEKWLLDNSLKDPNDLNSW